MASYDCYLDFLEVMQTEETCKALRAFFLKLIEVLKSDENTYCFAGRGQNDLTTTLQKKAK